MYTLYYMLFVILSVVANKDNFINIDDTRKELKVGDAPYFVTILKDDAYACNGVILTKRFILTSAACVLQGFHNYSVVYGTTKFDSDISSDNKKDILRVIGFRDFDSVDENNILRKYIRRNKYKNIGDHSDNDDDDDYDDDDYDDDDYDDDNDDDDNEEYEDYDIIRGYILSTMIAAEVNPFEFDKNVNSINLPRYFEQVPSGKGILVFGSAEKSLQSQQFPSELQVLTWENIVLHHGAVDKNDKILLRGSPFVINNTLYGLVVGTHDISKTDKAILFLINIPHVIASIIDTIYDQ